MLLNRNDKCYCGSGKKYKNCCMEKDLEQERYNRRLTEAQKQYAEIYTKIYRYSRDERFANEMNNAEDLFYILKTDGVKARFEKFFNTFFISDHVLEQGITIAQCYPVENKITDNEKRIIQSLISSYSSIYTIVKKEKESVLLRDCFLGEEVAVDDVKILKDFEEGDTIIARIVEVSGVKLLIDITVKIVESTGKFMVEDIERLYEQNKEDWPNKKIFLCYHTYVFYRYLQQLLDEEVSNYVRENLIAKANNEATESKETKEETTEDDGSVMAIINKFVEDEYKEKCASFWKEYEASHEEIKGSELGWAAAVEYLVKKEEGVSVTQASISKKYDISASTIVKRAKELKA